MIINAVILNVHEDNSSIIKCNWNDIKEYNIENWNLNRQPDKIRIPEIKDNIMKQKYVDGMIYMAYTKNCEKLICYDGIHRITALIELSKTDINISNYVLIIHLCEYNEEYMKQKFISLNKNIPVPDLFITDKDIKTTVILFVDKLQNKYSNFFSSSKRPNIPNINRDILTDKITDIIQTLKLNNITDKQLSTYFKKFNIIMELNFKNNLTKTAKKKM